METNKFIKIESEGIIEIGAFTLLGASTKRDDEKKIGIFGSGLKYSIAFLLRKNIPFKIFSDYKEFTFTTTAETFRDKEFNIIVINSIKTNMTTEMGIDWEPWFVIREIYCNAIDEGEPTLAIVNENKCLPIETKTVFYIKVTDEIQKVVDDWDKYFTTGRKDLIYSDKGNKIFAASDDCIIYRKGIRCYFIKDKKSCFHYDLSVVKINESRVAKSEWDLKWDLRSFLQEIKDTKVIAHILNTIIGRWEEDLTWDSESSLWSEEWLNVIGEKILVPYETGGYWDEYISEDRALYLILPAKMIDGLKERFVDKIKVIGDLDGLSSFGKFRVIPQLTPKQSQLLEDAVSFLKKSNYAITSPIKVVEFANEKTLGQARDKTILLSTKLFEVGRKQIVECIIEEQEHINTGFGDETREFQSHFIQKYVSMLEEKTGEYL